MLCDRDELELIAAWLSVPIIMRECSGHGKDISNWKASAIHFHRRCAWLRDLSNTLVTVIQFC